MNRKCALQNTLQGVSCGTQYTAVLVSLICNDFTPELAGGPWDQDIVFPVVDCF